MSRIVHNYLKAFRKCAGLTQRDLAYLAGLENSAAVSRIERSARLPSSKAVLAISIIFRRPIDSLYSEYVCEVERMVINRAKELYQEIDPRTAIPTEVHKRNMLRAIIEGRAPVESTALWTDIKKDNN